MLETILKVLMLVFAFCFSVVFGRYSVLKDCSEGRVIEFLDKEFVCVGIPKFPAMDVRSEFFKGEEL